MSAIVSSSTRTVPVPGSSNIRDFGGIPIDAGKVIRPQILYRGEAPSLIGKEGVEDLIQRGVVTFIDVRGETEQGEDTPDPLLPFLQSGKVQRLTIDVNPPLWWRESSEGQDPYNHLPASYTHSFRSGYKDLLEALYAGTEAGGGIYLHCMVGKDRTGIASAMVLLALGASREDAIEDFLESTTGFRELAVKLKDHPIHTEFADPDWSKILPRQDAIEGALDNILDAEDITFLTDAHADPRFIAFRDYVTVPVE